MASVVRAREPSPRLPAIGRVLVDSGPLLALFNAADAWHARVLSWQQQPPQAQLISTWPLATEVCALLVRRIGKPAALDFLRWAQRRAIGFDLPDSGSLGKVLALGGRFRDLPFNLADASVAEAASRLRIRHVLTIDADFEVYRDRVGKALLNVFLSPT